MRIGLNALDMDRQPRQSNSGISKFCYQVIQHLIENPAEFEYDIVVSEDLEIPEHWIGHERIRFHRATGLFASKKALWGMFSSQRFISRHRIDLWHSLANTLPLATQAKRVLTLHDLFTFTHPELYTKKFVWITNFGLRQALQKADRILSVSQFSQQEATRLLGTPERKFVINPLGVGNDLSGAADESPLGHPYLFTVSTLSPRKNLKRLAEAVAQNKSLLESNGFKIVVAGAAGWLNSDLAPHIRHLNVDHLFEFLGYIDESALSTYLKHAKAFILPSVTEGFGIPALEAMSLGTPCLLSETGSLKEVGGDAAEYFDPLDVSAMSRRIEECVAWTPDRRETYSKKSLTQARKFGWRQHVECLHDTYRSLL